jgi:hypothetical protein
MFQPSSNVDARLLEIAKSIEAREIGLRVISGCVYRVPFFRIDLDVFVQNPRRFNVLEEFVLRAAVEMMPGPSRQEIASLLGLDRLFVDAVCTALEDLDVIEEGGMGDTVVLTSSGKEFYAQGRVPTPPEQRSVELIYDGMTKRLAGGKLLSEANEADPVLPRVEDDDWAATEEIVISSINRERVIAAVTAAGMGPHSPEEGRVVIEIGRPRLREKSYYACGILIVQDTLATGPGADNVSVRIARLPNGQFDTAAQEIMDDWLAKGAIGLEDLLPGYDELSIFAEEPVVVPMPSHAQQVEQAYVGQTLAMRQGGQGPEQPPAAATPEAELLRNEFIRPRFLESLKRARRSVLIVSPWMTEQVVDGSFLKILRDLAKQGILVLMGWGIARDIRAEDHSPSEELLDSLHSIQTPDGIPAVSVWWLGNHHIKEVVVDQLIYMMGSHNWLSYRGDRLPRGESVFYVTTPEMIKNALDYLEPLFNQAAITAWTRDSQRPLENQAGLMRCCATFVAIHMADNAIDRTLDLAKSDPVSIPLAFDLLRLICLSLTRYSADELTHMKVLDSLSLAASELSAGGEAGAELDAARRGFGSGLAFLLRQYVQTDQSSVADFLNGQIDVWRSIGLIGYKQEIAEVLLDLRGTNATEGKKAKKKK